MRFTEEQQKIIESANRNILVNAGPGMGKTTLLLGISKQYKYYNKKIICFNKIIEEEIKAKIVKEQIQYTTVNTFHSLAFNFFKNDNKYIKDFKYRDYDQPIDYFSISELLYKVYKENFDANTINTIVELLEQYCTTNLSLKAFLEKKYLMDEKNTIDFYNKILNELIHFLMNNSFAPMFHSLYIKIFERILFKKKAIIKTDMLLVDEFQDVNACFLSIINSINSDVKIKVGDKMQSIYSYNGALGMDEHDLVLTKSFRISEENAQLCNKITKAVLNNEEYIIHGENKTQIITSEIIGKKTIIFRTNEYLIDTLLEETLQGKKCKISSNLLKNIKHAYKLARIENTFLGYKYRNICFYTIDDIKKYISLSNNKILKLALKFYEKYGNNIDKTFAIILNNIVISDEYDIYLTTAHRCKGAEYDNVEIANDFPTISELIENKKNNKSFMNELCVIYVAITRSFNKMKLNKDLEWWWKNA